MPTLDQVAAVTINKSTVFPTARGFGVPMFCAYQTLFPGVRLLEFAELTEVTEAGFSVNSAVYKGFAKIFGQQPRPPRAVLGTRALPSTQVVKFTPLVVTAGFIYSFKVKDAAGLETAISVTVQPGDVDDDVAADLNTALTPIAGMVSAVALEVVTCTATAGAPIEYYELPSPSVLKVEVTTADPGIATDLAAIALATQEANGAISWYGFTLDTCSEAEAIAAAAWAESNNNVFVARNSDSLSCEAGTTTDFFSDVKAAAYDRTCPIYAQNSIQDYRDAAWLAKFLAQNIPEGSTSPAFKTLAGITADKLTSARANAINAKNGTTYTTLAGVNITYEGKVGSGDFFDNVVNLDVLKQRSQEAFFSALYTAKKIPFTQKGINIAVGAVQAVLDQAVRDGMLAPTDENGNPPTATGPTLAETTAAQRASRRLVGCRVAGRLAGAIHGASFVFNIGV